MTTPDPKKAVLANGPAGNLAMALAISLVAVAAGCHCGEIKFARASDDRNLIDLTVEDEA